MIGCLQESYCWWKKSCTSWYGKYPITYRVSYMLGGVVFLPSTVFQWIVFPKSSTLNPWTVGTLGGEPWNPWFTLQVLWLHTYHDNQSLQVKKNNPPKTNISPETWWLEKDFPFETVSFLRDMSIVRWGGSYQTSTFFHAFAKRTQRRFTSWWNRPLWKILYSQIASFFQLLVENKKTLKPPFSHGWLSLYNWVIVHPRKKPSTVMVSYTPWTHHVWVCVDSSASQKTTAILAAMYQVRSKSPVGNSSNLPWGLTYPTLGGKIIFKMPFFGDMLVPWRVSQWFFFECK